MIYKNTELSNEQYRELPEVSGSQLVVINDRCPAALKYGEPKSSPALTDGIAMHVAILESEQFDSLYYRDIDPAEHPEALDTAKQMQAWLKEAGVAKYSSKTKPELIEMILATGDTPQVIDIMRSEAAGSAPEGATPLKPGTYDAIQLMRQTIRLNPEYNEALTGGAAELSIVRPEIGLKCRLDYKTKLGGIWDYKTTISAEPELFGVQCYKMGYWLKMALQHDLYVEEFGEEPDEVVLLAQEKTPPYICQAYHLTPEQLEIGREQYMAAKALHDQCEALQSWPAYGGRIRELATPAWVARMYDMDGGAEISIEVETENQQGMTASQVEP